MSNSMEELERPCCIQGYHVDKDVWEAAAVGEIFHTRRNPFTNGLINNFVIPMPKNTF